MRDPRLVHPDEVPFVAVTRCGTFTLPAAWKDERRDLREVLQLEMLHLAAGGVPNMSAITQMFREDEAKRKAFDEYVDVVMCETLIRVHNAGWWELESVDHVPQNVLTDLAFMYQLGWISHHVYGVVNARNLTKDTIFVGKDVRLATLLFGGFEGYAELEDATDD